MPDLYSAGPDPLLSQILGSSGEKVAMHVLEVLLPRVLASVAEAALSPLLTRVDRALAIAESFVEVAHEGVNLASKIADDASATRNLLERVVESAGLIKTG